MSETTTNRADFELNEWQITEIEAALREADASDFVSEKEVRAVMKKWDRGACRKD